MTYKLKSLNVTTEHWPSKALLVRDGAAKMADKAELEAQANSGDYISLLVTRLDQISQSLKGHHLTDYLVVEETIHDLLYLQRHYKLIKK